MAVFDCSNVRKEVFYLSEKGVFIVTVWGTSGVGTWIYTITSGCLEPVSILGIVLYIGHPHQVRYTGSHVRRTHIVVWITCTVACFLQWIKL